jgi:hypothetical protein
MVVIVVTSFTFSVRAAEKKKFTTTTKAKQTISSTTLYPANVPNHEIVQSVVVRTVTSSDPDFNGMEVIVYGQMDSVAGNGSHRGYATLRDKNGNEVYTKYEGTHKTMAKEGGTWERTSEGKSQVTGGTGKFKNIKGNTTYKCKFTAEGGGCDTEYEVEY